MLLLTTTIFRCPSEFSMSFGKFLNLTAFEQRFFLSKGQGEYKNPRFGVNQCSSVVKNITARLAALALCGLRPRIERNDCNFGRRLPCGHSPEATFAQCSLCARKMRLKINFHSFFLHICIFCCTFVASIQMKTVKTLHFDAINTMYISA